MSAEFANTAIITLQIPAMRRGAPALKERSAASVVIAPSAARQAQAAPSGRSAQLADAVETAFGGLVMLSVLLFAAALLRLCWAGPYISSNILHDAADAAYAAAAILGCGFLFIFARDVLRALRG